VRTEGHRMLLLDKPGGGLRAAGADREAVRTIILKITK
jgi:hypothetical protein